MSSSIIWGEFVTSVDLALRNGGLDTKRIANLELDDIQVVRVPVEQLDREIPEIILSIADNKISIFVKLGENK